MGEERKYDIKLFDNFLDPKLQADVYEYLKRPGWDFGAFSDPNPNASRYWYKHFAGYVKDGAEDRTSQEIEAELSISAPLLATVWERLKSTVVVGHGLSRCYANAYPFGSEGGLHLDSNIDDHMTVIYYPSPTWHPNFAGETVFFNTAGSDIVGAVYPAPNRLVVFSGVIPHVARGVSRICPELRITLMFKTTGLTSNTRV